MINIFICDDVINTISTTTSKLNDLLISIDNSNYKPYYIYAYSIFESTITEILRYYLTAFPYKIDNNTSICNKEILNFSKHSDIMNCIVDKFIRKNSSNSLYEYLSFFIDIQDLQIEINKTKISEISDLRNIIVHDDIKYSLIYTHNCNSSKCSDESSIAICRENIAYLIELLNIYKKSMSDKYGKYTYDRLVRKIWEDTFSTPLLSFDSIWKYNTAGYLELKDIENLKSKISSLSRNERLLLAIFLQQYNDDLTNYIIDSKQLPAFVSLDSNNKAKLVELISLFDRFPYIFNGDIINPL